jgi:hypothetical protein
VPSAAFHVTDLSEVDPATLAVKVNFPPVCSEVDEGDTVTEVTDGMVGFVGAAVTVTFEVSDLVGSATLVAVTVSAPAFAGAV